MRVIFMGKNKPAVVQALQYLIDSEIEVAAVVAPLNKPGLGNVYVPELAQHHGIPVVGDEELYRHLDGTTPFPFELGEIDLVLSFLFWKLIRKPLIDLGTIGCLNFHPAPLPEYGGWGVYNFPILNDETSWGVTAHWVDESFDTGDLIKVHRFDIDPMIETAYTLEQLSQPPLVELFQEVIRMALSGEPLPRAKQGPGTRYSRLMTEPMRAIRTEDSLEQINRKIRAFWYPPYGGATLNIGGEEFVIVNREVLEDIGRRYHEK